MKRMLLIVMALFLHATVVAAIHISLLPQWRAGITNMYHGTLGRFEDTVASSASGAHSALSAFFTAEADTVQAALAFPGEPVAVGTVSVEQLSLPSLHADLATIATASKNLILAGEQSLSKQAEITALFPRRQGEHPVIDTDAATFPLQWFTLQENDSARSIGNIAGGYGQNSGWKENSFSDSGWNRDKNPLSGKTPGNSSQAGSPTPEPGTLALLCIGAAGLAAVRKFRSV